MLTLLLAMSLGNIQNTAAEQDQAPFDFQGVVLGTVFSSLAPKFKPSECQQKKHERVCGTPPINFLNVPASVKYSFKVVDGSEFLYKIDVFVLSNASDTLITDALQKKWGGPYRVRYQSYTWRRSKYLIEFDMLAGGSAIRYVNSEVQDMVKAEEAAEAASEL